jgi:guanylate kinase
VSSTPLIVVLSGPSGVGKDSILERMRELRRPFHYTVTATTRLPRPGEVDGQDYYFVSPQWFEERLKDSGLLEHACVYGRLYGVPKAPVLQALQDGQDVIMRTNVEGAASIRRAAPGAVLVFVAPPSLGELEDRLRRRQTDSPDEIATRLAKVREEMECLPKFDYAIVNVDNGLDRCVELIDAIVQAERCRIGRPPLGLD